MTFEKNEYFSFKAFTFSNEKKIWKSGLVSKFISGNILSWKHYEKKKSLKSMKNSKKLSVLVDIENVNFSISFRFVCADGDGDGDVDGDGGWINLKISLKKHDLWWIEKEYEWSWTFIAISGTGLALED